MLRTLAVLLVGFIAATTANQSQVVMPLSELLEAMNCTSHTDGECMRGYSVTALTKKRALKRTYTSQKHQSHARSPYSNTKGASHNTRRAFNQEQVPLIRLTRDVLSPQRYDVRARPVVDHRTTLSIHVSMSLYQIIDVNEPSQNVKMNVWMIQKWRDESLNWDPRDYSMINTTILPHNVLWVPDTYLYNSFAVVVHSLIYFFNYLFFRVVMSADETERYMNIRVDSLFWEGRRGANMSFLYPAIYTVTCKLNIRYFPYDQQNCTLTIGSWTNSKSTVDYYADEHVNMASYIENGEWDVMSFRIFRHEYKYACCPEPWVILEASIILRRKPLYYVINLIIPTSIITLVAITGFFTPASTADDRTEKINLGITTLLAMSILMLMISDAMPTTSEFVPLIAWFYLSIIIIISIGTFLTSVILGIQSRRQYGELPPLIVRYWLMCRIRELLCMRVPPQLALIWDELNDHPLMAYHNPDCKEDSNTEDIILQKHDDSIDENVVTFCGDSARTLPPVERKIRSALIRQARQCGESNIATRPLSTLKPKRSRGGEIHASFKRNNGNRVRLNWQRVVNAVVQQENKAENAGNEVASSFDDSDNCNAAIVNPRPSLNVPMIDTATPCASPPLSTSPLNTSANLLTPTLPDKTSLFFAASPCISPVQLLTPTPSPKQPTFLVAPKRKMQSPGQNSTWGMAMTALGMTAHRKSTGSVAPCVPSGGGVSMPKLGVFSPEVAEMRRRRQCSLEWEFISTLLDRLFLILFTFTVLSVTAALMITGRIAQVQYENS